MMNNAEQIVETIQDMITIHSQEANAHLMRIGAIALESENIGEHARYYYESRARVFILNDLLEKIAKTPDDTQGIITARDDVSGELLAQEILSWTKRTYGEVIDECGERITSRYTALADDIERLCEKYLKKGV